MIIDNINWNDIQIFYNSGNTWKDITTKFKISIGKILEAKKSGLFISRTKVKQTFIIIKIIL
jgi:hypothetical protein